jgi:hypothetical protein
MALNILTKILLHVTLFKVLLSVVGLYKKKWR